MNSLPTALSIGAAGVYPYSDALLELGSKMSRFGDPYNMFRVSGAGDDRRILVPRMMVPLYVKDTRSEGLPASFQSFFVPRNVEQSRVIDESVALLSDEENFVVECPTGFGKSSPAGTPIIMWDGTVKTVESVVMGDVLMGPDSTPRIATGIHKSWSPIYRITPTKGDPFECNDVHVLSLKCTSDMKRSNQYKKGELSNIEVKDYIKQSKTFKHMMKLWRAPGIDLPERKVFDPYIVGLYLADGTQNGTPVLCCGKVKLPALQHVESVWSIGSKRFDRGAWYISLPGFQDIQATLTRNKARHIPDRYLRNSRENRLQLLAGLLDGDGHLVKGSVFELACKDASFKDEVLFLCRSLGFAAYAHLSQKGIKSTGFSGEYWVITISGNTNQIPTKIPSKQAAPRQQKKDHLVTGFKVEYVRDDWVYGFQLDKDHLYLLGDFTVTHNTACAMQIIATVGLKTLVVVTKEDIRDQWFDAAVKFLHLPPSKIGFIQGDRFEVQNKSLVIAMVQSLAKESRYPLGPLREFGLAIWDEVHRTGADYFSQSCFRVPAKLRMGLSATPDRKDGREGVIRAHIGPVRVSSEVAPMTPRVVTRKSPWKVPMTSITDPETGKKIVGPIPHTPGRCGHIINMMAKHYGRNSLLAKFIFAAFKKGRHVLIQSDRIEHLETLASMVISMGVHSSVVGFYARGLSKGDREVIKTKQIIFATYQMTAEATDIPRMDTLVMATPKSDVRQIVGRILRPHKDKAEPLVLDVIDDSSGVFSSYWRSRRKWYKSVGASVSEPVEEANCG